MKPPSNGASSSISPSSFERRNAPFSAQHRERQVPARCGFARTRIGNPRPSPRKSGSQPTLRWREQDSNPRSPRSRNAIPLWRKGTGEGSRRRQEAVPRQRVPEAGPHGAPRAAASVRLSAEGVTPICDAAARKLRLSATATNAVRSARSARRIAEFLSAPNETISDIHLGYWTTHKGSKVQMPRLGCHRRPIRS
jgi:hypothetical protein